MRINLKKSLFNNNKPFKLKFLLGYFILFLIISDNHVIVFSHTAVVIFLKSTGIQLGNNNISFISLNKVRVIEGVKKVATSDFPSFNFFSCPSRPDFM